MTPDPEIAAQLNAIDTRWAKAMAHPVRARALAILSEQVASPSDIAREIGLPVANVSYHVNTLLRLGCIREVEHRHVRGAIEHLYRAVERPLVWCADWHLLPRQVQNALTTAWLESTIADLKAGVEEELFGALPDQHLTRTPLVLDQAAFEEISEALAALLQRALELQAESADRLKDGANGGPVVDARLILATFGRAQPAGRGAL